MKNSSGPVVWIHSPSYGEFEEVRPVIDEIKKSRPECRFLVTFFSPSGYEHLKNDPVADWVFYLPVDTPINASRFLNAVKPEIAIFAIADFWLFFLHALRKRHIPTYLVSGRFNREMSYFKPFGKAWIKAFRTCFTTLFVNTEESVEVLHSHGVENCILTGDTRIDRVLTLADEKWSDPVVDSWCNGCRPFVGGSILPGPDEMLMLSLAKAFPEDKFIIVPHETSDDYVHDLQRSFQDEASLYTNPVPGTRILIVNVVGILARLYRYGFAAYVGGGFEGAPHSIVEPAAHGIPVAFGPQFGPVWHCRALIGCKAGISVRNAEELAAWYGSLKSDPDKLASAGAAGRSFCESGRGASGRVAAIITEV